MQAISILLSICFSIMTFAGEEILDDKKTTVSVCPGPGAGWEFGCYQYDRADCDKRDDCRWTGESCEYICQ